MPHTAFARSKKMFWLPLAACLAWLGLTAGLYRQAARVAAEHSLELEHTRLSTMAGQLLDARNWNAAHGGVYVPQGDEGQPNPWLPEKERTVTTVDGRALVLVNPAYMSRQLAERSSREGLHIGIVGNAPLRPQNRADAWEASALAQCVAEPQEVFTPPQQGDGRNLRLLSVLTARASCLRCHVDKKEGDVLGGISIRQDATALQSSLRRQRNAMRLLYGLLALTGVLAIGGLTLNLTRRRWLAEEASRMKSAFMGRLSHDMHTPLTAVVSMSELALQPDLPEEERARALGYLARAARALREMVGDVTDHAALEQGAPTLEADPFDLRRCLRDCVDLYLPVARDKGLTLSLTVDERLPTCAVGDSFRLRQALGNIVGNAVKYTPSGHVGIAARLIDADAAFLRLALEVSDTGPGLGKEEQRRVFESFRRGRNTARTPGTGLGLSIARTLARLMNGDVTLVSEPGCGARFTLEARLRQCGPGQLPPDDPQGSTKRDGTDQKHPLAGKTVLVAEDTPSIAFALEHMLRDLGACPQVADTGDAALRALRGTPSAPWGMAILDARLPGASGLDVLRAIRMGDAGDNANLPVVLYTAAADRRLARACEDLRADALLLKPLSFAQLRHRLATIAAACEKQPGTPPPRSRSRSHTTPRPPETAPAAPPASSAPQVWDTAAALAALDGDAPLLRTLAAVLETELEQRGHAVDAALGAMLGAMSGVERENLRRVAHACKNSAGTLRLDRLRDAATATEDAAGTGHAEEELEAAARRMRAAIDEALRALREQREAPEHPAMDKEAAHGQSACS